MIYSGAGNTFVMVEGDEKIPCPDTIDGVIHVLPSTNADFRMKIINRDGSEGKMCGNGIRCMVQYLADTNRHQERYQIETASGILSGWFEDEKVAIEMSPPSKVHEAAGRYIVDTGAPHSVGRVTNWHFNITEEGSVVVAGGHNATYFEVVSKGLLKARTYELGVHAVTEACGTGATAAAIVYHRYFGGSKRVDVQMPGGTITIDLTGKRPIMIGLANKVSVE